MLIVVAGMPGAGSSTVIQRGLEMLRHMRSSDAEAVEKSEEASERAEFVHLNYGDVMFEIASQEGIINRDQIRKLPHETQTLIQKKACRRIADMSKDANIVLDTHCTIKTPFGYLPGLPADVLHELSPRLFVLIEAFPHEIARRRKTDKTRMRDEEAEEDIAEHQAMNRAISMAYACLTGAPVKIIENHDGEIEKAAREFAETVMKLHTLQH
ncbi:MAG: adenylate kinase [Candidatus Methanospirare jalkutatii]|nr:adenylate kinase [Candidatus Methanospirare jalkutatii]MCW7077843.1 adenylate kinase [Candidatus Methanoxibalbensis ujae]RLG38992.1 MAG: adenylate kinase [Methanosarcinales archaeon]